MANVIIKDEERREHEAYVRRSYGVRESDREAREHTEIIAAKSREAVKEMDRIGGRKTWSF